MTPRKLLLAYIFLMCVADAGSPYSYVWFAPFGWASTLLDSTPWKLRGLDHILLYCLYKAGKKGRSAKSQPLPMRQAMLIALGSIIFAFCYGTVRGGDPWAGIWQIYLLMSGVLLAFVLSFICRTPADFVDLAKAVLWGAGYRAGMCVLYFFFHISSLPKEERPEFLTSHDDTVLWVTVAILVIVLMLQGTVRGWRPVAYLVLIFLAIFFNQRRLAWVSLVMGLLTAVALLPRKGKARKRAGKAAMALAPLIVLYVVVGWGRPEPIFKPLQSFATVTTQEDASTLARNAENLGLITTSNLHGILFGSGWGHAYYEYTSKYSIAHLFPLWRFVPHNSILALLAFTGVFGFFGFWLPFPTAMFINARMASMARDPHVRSMGIIACANAVVCANQFYGDMGAIFPKPVYFMAMSYAVALRLGIPSGAWPSSSKTEGGAGPSVQPPPGPAAAADGPR